MVRKHYSLYEAWLKQKGFSTLEVLIALGVFIIIVTPIVMLDQISTRSQLISDQRLQAVLLAEEGLEAASSIRDKDWNDLTAGSHGLSQTSSGWTFSGENDVNGIFVRTINVTDISTDERQVVSTIQWQTIAGASRQLSLETTLTNWRGPIAGSTTTLDIGETGNDIAVIGNYAYLAVNDDDRALAVVDVSDPQNPVEVAALDLNERGEHIFIDGNYAYLPLNEEEIAIVDISNPLNPQHVSSIYLSVKPNDLYVEDGWAYIGQNSSNRGLIIYNVANPQTPWFYRSYNISNQIVYDTRTYGPWIYMTINAGRGFEIANNLVYVAVDSEATGFEVYDLNINLLSQLNVSGAGTRVDVEGTTVYLGVKNITQGVTIIDVSDPNNPQITSTHDVGGSGNGVDKNGPYTYAAVENSQQGFAQFLAP